MGSFWRPLCDVMDRVSTWGLRRSGPSGAEKEVPLKITPAVVPVRPTGPLPGSQPLGMQLSPDPDFCWIRSFWFRETGSVGPISSLLLNPFVVDSRFYAF